MPSFQSAPVGVIDSMAPVEGAGLLMATVPARLAPPSKAAQLKLAITALASAPDHPGL